MSVPGQRDEDLTARGGAQGMAAHHADMRAYAAMLDRVASDLAAIAKRAAAIGIEPDVLTSTPFATRAFSEVQGSLAEATAGSNGLLALALRLEGRALLLRTKADLIEAADSFGGFVLEMTTRAGAHTIGSVALPLAPLAITGTVITGGLVYGKALVEEGADSVDGFLRGDLSFEELAASVQGDFGDAGVEALTDVHRLLLEHPGITDRVVVGLPHLVNGLLGPVGLLVPDDDEGVIGQLLSLGGRAGLFHDPTFTPRKVAGDPQTASNLSLADLVDLSNRNHERVVTDRSKTGIRILAVKQGHVTRYVVQLPGTQEWGPVSGTDPSDLTTNLELSDDGQAAIMTAVLHAMEQDIPEKAEVLLMGHSQGGILAAALAADPLTARYDVKGVLTYGSPVGRIPIPEGIKVLSVEHLQDPVPRTDGTDNPDTVNRTTVYREPSISELEELSLDRPLTVIDAHSAELYRNSVQQIEAAAAGGDDRLLRAVADFDDFFGADATTASQDWNLMRGANP